MFLVTTIVEGQVCERVNVSGRVDLQQAPLQSEVRHPNTCEQRWAKPSAALQVISFASGLVFPL